MTRKKRWSIWGLTVLLVSCVTVNIYFPAAAIQKAADQIVDDVRKTPEQKPEQKQEQKQDKQKEFQTRVEAYQKMVKAAEQEVSSKDNEYAAKSLADIKGIIVEIAKERKLTMIFGTSDVGLLYADPDLDLTQQVIQRYDARAK